jgi:hypothetical protein
VLFSFPPHSTFNSKSSGALNFVPFGNVNSEAGFLKPIFLIALSSIKPTPPEKFGIDALFFA